MAQYVNANGWWVQAVRKDWKEGVTKDAPEGTVLGSVTCGDWVPVAMWKVKDDDVTTAVPIIIEDGNRFVEMCCGPATDNRENFYSLEYSGDSQPPEVEPRDIVK